MVNNMIDRNALITDLREHTIEVFLKSPNGVKSSFRCSLKEDMLPASYANSEKVKVDQFLTDNPNMVAAWNMTGNGWVQFDMNTVEYVQVVDTF